MDTDSLILSLEEDFYETIKENPERFNTSKYKLNKEERYSRVPRLSDTHYSDNKL